MTYKQYIPKGAKGITPADHKFITKYILPKMENAYKEITNPWSGETVAVNPLISALVTMVYSLNTGSIGAQIVAMAVYGVTSRNWVSRFDRARYLILKLDSSIYSKFID